MENGGYSKIVASEYRLTRTDGGLKIEVLDYHAGPVVLTPEVLGEFGLVFLDAPQREPGIRKRRKRSRELGSPPRDPLG